MTGETSFPEFLDVLRKIAKEATAIRMNLQTIAVEMQNHSDLLSGIERSARQRK